MELIDIIKQKVSVFQIFNMNDEIHKTNVKLRIEEEMSNHKFNIIAERID